jgi:hypothetical protein
LDTEISKEGPLTGDEDETRWEKVKKGQEPFTRPIKIIKKKFT